jgi:hypothetical protein
VESFLSFCTDIGPCPLIPPRTWFIWHLGREREDVDD